MPELPEVETVRKTLLPIVGATITKVWVGPKGLHMGRKPPRAKLAKLVGATFTTLRRHGKYLLLDTDIGRSLLVHLGMTGRLRIHKIGEPRASHTHLVLTLDDRELRYVDARRFGQIDVVETAREREHEGLAVLGPDPITHGIDTDAMYALAKSRKQQLKAFVLDQGVVAGMGNIYVSEALWRSQLRPTKRANKLTREQAHRLADACRDVLHDALENNGTSLRDFVDADGAEGSNWEYLNVYDRAGQPCKRCKTSIKRIVLQGRATYYCPTCQTP
jgi:formamidopyrimidine-DNA glycosylase